MRYIKIVLALFTLLFLVSCKKNKVYQKEDNFIYFGSYPQTLETDESIIKELNNKADKWNDYNYYINGNKDSFMYYKDIDLNNDNNYDYRGVYFTKYRPTSTLIESSESRSYQDDNGYLINNVYWFKYEKIKWRILEEKDNKCLLLSDILLDSQSYCDSTSDEPFYEHNGGVGSPNNYELSDIRKWLNESFYNTSFNIKEKEIIINSEVDNSLDSTTWAKNAYVCDNTFDNIFLLSNKEVEYIYFKDKDSRVCKGTDYAKIQGLMVSPNMNSYWRLRTPYTNFNNRDTHIDHTGERYNLSVNNTGFGIRPGLWIKL